MVSQYAQSIGVEESDARTARNIRLSVADCKHLRVQLDLLRVYGPMLSALHGVTFNPQAMEWNSQLAEYLRTAE